VRDGERAIEIPRGVKIICEQLRDCMFAGKSPVQIFCAGNSRGPLATRPEAANFRYFCFNLRSPNAFRPHGLRTPATKEVHGI
jgi:hypothetical protein